MESRVIYLNGEPTKYIMYEDSTVINTNTGKEVKSWVNSHGRYEICLFEKGKKYYRRIARLKAELFIPNPNNYPEVDHINGNRLDDRISNLEWVTSEVNLQRAKDLGIQSWYGEDSPVSILTESDVHEICKQLELGVSGKDISEEYNISRTNVSDIKNGKIWTHISNQYNLTKKSKCALTEEDVVEICFMIKDGMKQSEIAKIFNVGSDTIGKIKRKERWTQVTEGLL